MPSYAVKVSELRRDAEYYQSTIATLRAQLAVSRGDMTVLYTAIHTVCSKVSRFSAFPSARSELISILLNPVDINQSNTGLMGDLCLQVLSRLLPLMAEVNGELIGIAGELDKSAVDAANFGAIPCSSVTIAGRESYLDDLREIVDSLCTDEDEIQSKLNKHLADTKLALSKLDAHEEEQVTVCDNSLIAERRTPETSSPRDPPETSSGLKPVAPVPDKGTSGAKGTAPPKQLRKRLNK